MITQRKSHDTGNKPTWKKPSVTLAATARNVRGGAVVATSETILYTPS
jgi:hypothetical protein